MEKFDLTGKLVDCSELIEMEYGEVIFNAVKEMCKGVNDGSMGQFKKLGLYEFPCLTLSEYNSFMFADLEHKKYKIIKPIDVLGVYLMSALKSGATLVKPGDIISSGKYKLYWRNDTESTDINTQYSIINPDVIAYKLINPEPAKPADITPEGTERIFTSNEPHALPVFMKLGHDFQIQNYEFVINKWVTQADQHDMVKKWDSARRLPVMPCVSIESKILAEKVGTSAQDIIKAGLGHIGDRAATYDKPEGERSMAATVAAFNAVTGHKITEEQGWHFMTILKIVRSQQGNFKLDNYEDGSAYFGLAGEAASKERSKP